MTCRHPSPKRCDRIARRSVARWAAACWPVMMLGLALTWTPAAYAQEAPRVIETYPANGEKSVPAGETELHVTFDRDMAESYSWTKGGNLFPEVVSAPTWETPRKCVLKVKLEPNKLYTFGINGFTANRFQDKKGVAAQRRVISFRTKAPGGVEPVEFRGSPANLDVFNALQKAFDQAYSYRELRGVNWQQQFDAFRQRFLESRTTDELTYHIADLLALAKDPHITIEHDGTRYATSVREYEPNFSSRVLGASVKNLVKVNNTIYTGKYPDGIVYILIASWDSKVASDLSELGKLMDDLSEAPAIILDVRPNTGGNDLFCQALARRFVTEPITYEKIRVRDNSQPGGFTEPTERRLEPLPSGPQFKGKLAVLMGPANMSSCEAFLLMMKQIKQAQLIGEPSYGSSGNPQPHEIGDGIIVHLPSWQAMLPDGELLEGQGVQPDVLVETEAADFSSEDPVINAALEKLRNED